MKKLLLHCLSIITLCGCVNSKVLNIKNASADTSPEQISQRKNISTEQVVWGGVIVDARNLQSYTQLEVLAYPLRRQLQPNTAKSPIGRFIMRHTGYLETEDFAPGRNLTVVGTVQRLIGHTIGDVSVDVPMLQSEELHLWPVNNEQSQSRFSFGLGISIGN